MDSAEIGRRDFASILMWIVAALFGRWKIPAQLAPAAELVQKVITERAIFKGGTLKIALRIKGYEVPESWLRDGQFRQQFAQALEVGSKEEEASHGPIAAG